MTYFNIASFSIQNHREIISNHSIFNLSIFCKCIRNTGGRIILKQLKVQTSHGIIFLINHNIYHYTTKAFVIPLNDMG